MKQKKPTKSQQTTTPKEEEALFTKEDFLKALKKATRPLSPKPSNGKAKKKPSA